MRVGDKMKSPPPPPSPERTENKPAPPPPPKEQAPKADNPAHLGRNVDVKG